MRLNQPKHFSVLSEAEASQVVDKVYELRSEWKPFEEGRTIFRLGATSNAMQPEDLYMAEVRHTRPLLLQHFGDLLERVRLALEPALQEIKPAPVVLDHQFGLPGFHLFITDEQNRDPLRFHGGFHCDMVALTLDWQPPLADSLPLEHCISFTLALLLPPAGGGLLVCEGVTSNDVLAYSEQHKMAPMDATAVLAERTKPVYHAYQVGHMVMHSGQVVHAPAPWKHTPGERRFTLQGHGFFIDDRWRLFW